MVTPTLTHTYIELHIPDFELAKNFYQSLGFQIVWETKPGKEGYLVMRLGQNILGFYAGSPSVYDHPYFSRFAQDTPRGYGVELTIQILDDIQAYYQRLLPTFGKYLLSPLEHRDYGTSKKWEFRLVDPFGYYLHFTEPVNLLLK